MKWVYNPYDKDFELCWGGKPYKLVAKDYSPLPEDVINAFFPSDKIIEPLLPKDFERKMTALRAILEIFLCRWRGQIEIDLTGDVTKQNEKILEWFSEFQILDKKLLRIKEKVKND